LDSYKSIIEALVHGGVSNDCKVQIVPIHAKNLESDANRKSLLKDLDGILVAPGFGERGTDGKIEAVKYARENKIPFFGICLGMQLAVVEIARNVLKLEEAHSSEFEPKTEFPVITIMEEQLSIINKGGTMRLGAYDCAVKKESKAFRAYGKELIAERHRHRYEFNNDYLDQFEQNGLKAAGINPKSNLVEIVELEDHPYFVGVQFHPEYKSRVEKPHPLFIAFIAASLKNKKK
jgi:CTP synthase